MEIMSVDTVTRSTAETAAYYETVLGLPVPLLSGPGPVGARSHRTP
jgi:hypothetical protein